MEDALAIQHRGSPRKPPSRGRRNLWENRALAESPRTTERDSEEILLDHLESRRGELAEAQWHAPGLVIAAQAFLLQVLTDASVAGSVSGCSRRRKR